jgi:hypothetical protein
MSYLNWYEGAGSNPTLHLACAYEWQAIARDRRDDVLRLADGWNGVVRSMTIHAPAVEDAIRCVECGGSATPEDPDAAVCRWCGGVFWDTVPADDDGLLIDAEGMVTNWAH